MFKPHAETHKLQSPVSRLLSPRGCSILCADSRLLVHSSFVWKLCLYFSVFACIYIDFRGACLLVVLENGQFCCLGFGFMVYFFMSFFFRFFYYFCGDFYIQDWLIDLFLRCCGCHFCSVYICTLLLSISCASTYIWINVCMYVCMYLCMYKCMQVYIQSHYIVFLLLDPSLYHFTLLAFAEL